MARDPKSIRFKTKLHCPASVGKDSTWSFLVLPKSASAKLPRRGRTTVEGTINEQPFQATLEPDGERSHWLKVSQKMREAADAAPGDEVALEITPLAKEPDPKLPTDLKKALDAAPDARTQWAQTTTVARLDWIHWITSAKKKETRTQRVANACDMLASGKRRVCCFDPSGFYSKAFSAPEAAQKSSG